jgi:two-component sensor histidine kinase
MGLKRGKEILAMLCARLPSYIHWRGWLFPLFMVISVQSIKSQTTDDGIRTVRDRFLEAKSNYEKALMEGDSSEIMDKAYVFGKRLFDFGDYFEARKWFYKALQYDNSKTTPLEYAKIHTRFAFCEESEEDWENYMHHMALALHYSLQTEEHDYIIGSYIHLGKGHLMAYKSQKKGATYSFLPSLDSAVHYNRKAFQMVERHKNPVTREHIDLIYGEILVEKGLFEEGITMVKSAYQGFDKAGKGGLNGKVGAMTLIGGLYLEKGDRDEAKKWLLMANELAENKSVPKHYVLAVKELLGKYYASVGDWKAAYQMKVEGTEIQAEEKQAYMRGSDEVLTLLRERQVQTKELVAKSHELKLLSENAAMQAKLNWIVRVGLALALMVGIFLFRLYRKYKTVSIENARLVKEQSHRMKNNLQSIYDLLSIQIAGLSDIKARAALAESMNRVEAVTRVHQRLYQGDRLVEVDLPTFLPELVRGVLRGYDLTQVEQEYEIDAIWLHADQAIPLGLIVNELIANASKYGLRKEGAMLRIVCSQDKDRAVHFLFSDNGPGFVKADQPSSFGLQLIALLVQQLKGSYAFNTVGGTEFQLIFKRSKKREKRSELSS